MQKTTLSDNNIAQMPLAELRQKWAECWGVQPHARIGRSLLERSLEFKLRERAGQGMTDTERKRLEQLVWSYRRNPKSFDEKDMGIKPGTKLVKIWKDKRHVVTVLHAGFEYKGDLYTNLTAIANEITCTKWNGWLFFNLRKRKYKK